MPAPPRKSVMRNLGEFCGHIWNGVRANPARKIVRKDVEEEQREHMVLRRTTIEEVEIKKHS